MLSSSPPPPSDEPASDSPESILSRISGIATQERERLLAAIGALRESESRYRSLVETSAQVVWRADSEGRLVDRRARWSAVTGLALDQLPDEPLDLVHPEDRPHGTRRWWDAVARREPLSFEQRVRWAGGGYRHWQVRGAPVYADDGSVREWIGADTDVTERKRAEGHLRQLNQISLAISAAATRDEVLRLVADEARELIGARRAFAVLGDGQGWYQSFSHESRADEAGAADVAGLLALASRRVAPLLLTRAELAGHPAVTDAAPRGWLSAPLVGRDGQSLGLIALVDRHEDDFSEADEALLQQIAQLSAVAIENRTLYELERAARAEAEQASRLKDEFLATVSHELRTPLTAFLGYAQMLQMRKRDEDYIARTVEKMVRSARVQAQLIDDLLDVSRIVSGMLRIDPQRIDMAVVVRAALDTVRPAVEAKGLRLDVELVQGAAAVVGDAGRLQQVVWNLLSNAVKFTPAGGMVQVRLAPHAGHAQLIVSDTGRGIAREFLPFVFDRFRQADSTSRRHEGGLGLGLAIVRHVVELHGGAVQAASDGAGRGATFTVWLPLSGLAEPEAAQAEALPPSEDVALELRGLRVLLVDDQPELLEVLRDILMAGGAAMLTAERAQEALALVQSWRPDVLISDLAMPGDDGYWLVRQVRALTAEAGGATPAIALTAYVREEEQAQALAAGFQRYLAKPVDAAALRAAVAGLAAGEQR